NSGERREERIGAPCKQTPVCSQATQNAERRTPHGERLHGPFAGVGFGLELGFAPGIGLKAGNGVGPASSTGVAVGMRPEVSGVSITPYVSLIGCLLRNLVRVQRSTVIPASRIFEVPSCESSWVTCTIVPGVR